MYDAETLKKDILEKSQVVFDLAELNMKAFKDYASKNAEFAYELMNGAVSHAKKLQTVKPEAAADLNVKYSSDVEAKVQSFATESYKSFKDVSTKAVTLLSKEQQKTAPVVSK